MLLVLGLAACTQRADVAADRTELLRLHELARTAHLTKRADILIGSFADSVLEVSRGQVALRSRADNQKRFQGYFDQVNFQNWDDLAPPRIRMSPDGQMAHVVVQKSVRLTSTDSVGAGRVEHTVFAWVEMYEKHDGKWTLMAVASTDRPGAADSTRDLTMTPTQVREFATRYTAAWCSHEPQRVAEFFAERGSLTINRGAPAVGRAAIAAAAQGFMTAFPDLVVVMDSLETTGPAVRYHWTLTGANTGPGGTGRPVRISGYEEWTFGPDGRIARSLGHFDEVAYRAQLEGAAQPPRRS